MISNTTIATARLRIVPFSQRHLTERYVGWLNDPEVVRYSEQRFATHTLESCRAYWLSFQDTPNRFWAIEIAGMVGPSSHIGNVSAHVEPHHMLADVGILIGDRGAWGKGYGTEAWIAVCEHLFRAVRVRKITAGTVSSNLGMLAIMDRAGMVDDGRRCRHYLVGNEEVDLVHRALFAPGPKSQ